MARAMGARAQMLMAYEATYGTAPATGFFKMPFARSTLGTEQPLLSSELLGYGRDPLPPVLDAITSDGNLVVPIDTEAFGFWLKGAFGAPTTTGTTNRTHTFQTGSWTLPSMAIEVGMPDVPRFAMFTGCMVDQLSWSMARSGLLTSEVSLVAQGSNVVAATAAGTPTEFASLQRFGQFNGSVKRDGAVLGNVTAAEVTYKNNLDRIETIRADGKIDGADPTLAELTGTIDVRFADTVLEQQAINGLPCSLELGWQISTNLSLFLTTTVFLPRPRLEISGPGGVQASFNWQAAKTGAGAMASIVLKNARTSY